jgi:NADPH:quinone reductase-like Zn-dependent oxidoreductase
MKAVVLRGPKAPIELADWPLPEPKPQEVRLRLLAAALNRRDFWISQGLYPGIQWPVVPGSDGVGVVDSLGSEVSGNWLGQTVLVNPNINWGPSERVQAPDYHILGMPTQGTLAQYLCVSVDRLHPLPAHLSPLEAAAVPLAGLTAWRALFSRGLLKPGQRVLVTGLGGGVALWAIQLARTAGASVWATSGSDEKLAQAADLIDGGINYRQSGWAKELREASGGFDLIVDGAAGADFPALIELVQPGGNIVIYGGTAGNFPAFNAGRLFWKQVNILGSTMGSDSDFVALLDFVEKSLIVPRIDRVYNLSAASKAFDRMNHSEQLGKLVIQIAD